MQLLLLRRRQWSYAWW